MSSTPIEIDESRGPVASETLWGVPDATIVPLRRFSVEEYERLLAAGILTDADRVELLEGWIVAKMPKNPPHMVPTALLQAVLTRLLPAG